jgi:hypothetical protein
VLNSVENFTDRVSQFDNKVEIVLKKFKRLTSDWLALESRIEK